MQGSFLTFSSMGLTKLNMCNQSLHKYSDQEESLQSPFVVVVVVAVVGLFV